MAPTIYRWIILWLGIGYLTGCGFSFEPTYPIIHPRYLLLQDAQLPVGWKEDPPCDAVCDAAQLPGHAEQSFSRWTVAGVVVQNVYAHRTSAEAEQRFHRYRSVIFRHRAPPDITLAPNPDIPFRSRYAQQEMIGCGSDRGVRNCMALLRYHNYVIELYIDWAIPPDNQGMEAKQIYEVLQALEDRVARCVVGQHIPVPDPPC